MFAVFFLVVHHAWVLPNPILLVIYPFMQTIIISNTFSILALTFDQVYFTWLHVCLVGDFSSLFYEYIIYIQPILVTSRIFHLHKLSQTTRLALFLWSWTWLSIWLSWIFAGVHLYLLMKIWLCVNASNVFCAHHNFIFFSQPTSSFLYCRLGVASHFSGRSISLIVLFSQHLFLFIGTYLRTKSNLFPPPSIDTPTRIFCPFVRSCCFKCSKNSSQAPICIHHTMSNEYLIRPLVVSFNFSLLSLISTNYCVITFLMRFRELILF